MPTSPTCDGPWSSSMREPNTNLTDPSTERPDFEIYKPIWPRFLHGITLNYRQCPDCGQTWAPVLSNARVTRVGRETFTCKCRTEWKTGFVEWSHLSPEKKRSYFFSEAEIGVAAISILVPPIFGYFVADRPWQGVVTAAKWGSIVGSTSWRY